MTYINNINERQQSIVYSVLEFEKNNEVTPNFSKYINKFHFINNQEILKESKAKVKSICQNNYERHWSAQITGSPKAISYIKVEHNINLEKYLYEVKKHQT